MNVKNEDKAFPTKKVEYSIIDLPPKTKIRSYLTYVIPAGLEP